jgi:copper chaperone NosL
VRRGTWLLAVALSACSSGPPPAATLDARNEWCAWCRMAISEARLASQLVAPGEEPRFFDDLGCLGNYLKGRTPPPGSMAYVADHRTKAWVPAASAVYTRVEKVETPMSSHLLAHVDARSRDQDPEAATGVAVSALEIFGPAGPPGGLR